MFYWKGWPVGYFGNRVYILARVKIEECDILPMADGSGIMDRVENELSPPIVHHINRFIFKRVRREWPDWLG